MKKTLILLLPICFIACQKKIAGTSQPNPLITQAQTFFNGVLSKKLPFNNANFRANQVRVCDWNQAKVLTLSVGPTVVVPIHFDSRLFLKTALAPANLLDLSLVTKLAIFRDSTGTFSYQVLTLIPDRNTIANNNGFSGIVLSEDWSGNSLTSPQRMGQPMSVSSTSPRPVIVDDMVISVCTEIDGYNYAVGDAENGEAWEETTCTLYSFGGGESGAGSSTLTGTDYSDVGGGGGAAAGIRIPSPTNPIANIADYLKCFTNVGGNGHTYTATLAVEQPVPGSRTPWGLSGTGSSATGNPVNVGHTWLILTETTAYGSTSRNVGFYPGSLIVPQYPTAQGVLNDDESIAYNIALTITVTDAQFFNILNFVSQGNGSGWLYNLNTNNCTTFTLNALMAGGISIPTTRGIWTDGSGDDPGDLGQDLRSMPLQSNMSLTTVGNFHPNVGSCN
jgi:hypothetical protein